MRVLSLILLVCVVVLKTHAQGEEKASKGDFSGQWRTYSLSTFNKDSLKDFTALATGFKLKYTYDLSSKWQLGGALYSSFNTNVQDLTVPDPTTGRVSRYEAGLFDVQNLDDQLILFPGELYVKFHSRQHEIKAGRMKLKTPFINPQDGRMIPTLEQGVWYTFQPEKVKVQVGWIDEIAPRSTGGFFDIGASIGTYPTGRNPDGRASQYAGQLSSDFILVAGVETKLFQKVTIKLWDYYVDNIFNAVFLKPSIPIGEKGSRLTFEAMLQSSVNNGGNAVDSLAYFQSSQSGLLGVQYQLGVGKDKFSLSYNRILNSGRFLFPREWGRETIFSFQKRERSEGTANNHAVVFTHNRIISFSKSKLKSIFSIGHHWKPELSNAEDNKYALPDYYHLNWDLFFNHEKWKGLQPELLLTSKIASGDVASNPNFFLNKVDMFQINFIVNYNF